MAKEAKGAKEAKERRAMARGESPLWEETVIEIGCVCFVRFWDMCQRMSTTCVEIRVQRFRGAEVGSGEGVGGWGLPMFIGCW